MHDEQLIVCYNILRKVEPHRTGWEAKYESRQDSESLSCGADLGSIDTGHQFFKMDANATGSGNSWLADFGDPYTEDYFVGSAAHITSGIIYTGNDNGRFYALDANDLNAIVSGGYYDDTIQDPGFICSSPVIGYNVDANHNRWVFITTRADGGKLYAFKTIR